MCAMFVYRIMLVIRVSGGSSRVIVYRTIGFVAVMMAAVIDITSDEQREIVRRLFRDSGNVNVKTKDVIAR